MHEIPHRKTFKINPGPFAGATFFSPGPQGPPASLSGRWSLSASAAALRVRAVRICHPGSHVRSGPSTVAEFCLGGPEVKNKSSTDKIYFDRWITSPPGAELPYTIVENLVYRPEPGYDDGPRMLPGDKSWHDPEPWDFESAKRQQPLFGQILNDYDEMGGYEESELSLCPSPDVSWDSEPLEPVKFDLESELSRPERCRKGVVCLTGEWTGSVYYAPLHCMRFWCPQCGGKGGFIRDRRRNWGYAKMNHGKVPRTAAERKAVANRYQVGQLILTTPEKIPDNLKGPDGVRAICGALKRTVKRFFPDENIMVNFQMCGDKHPERLHIHPHALIFYRKEEHQRLRLAPEKLAAIKDRLAQELRAIGFEGIRGPGEQIEGKLVDVRYNFASTAEQVMHKINYATRPLGPEHLKAWQASENGPAMIDLNVRGLKGFRAMRFWGPWAGCRYKDEQDVKAEVQSVVGEPLQYNGLIGINTLQDLIQSAKVRKIGRDFYVWPGPFAAGRSP